MKRRLKRGYLNDKDMQKLWRLAVLAEWGGVCVFKATDEASCWGPVECHHVKKRRIPHLRHAPSNGIPLCKGHHAVAETRQMRLKIEEMIGPDKLEWLDAMERTLKDTFLEMHGISWREYMLQQERYLKALIQRYESYVQQTGV